MNTFGIITFIIAIVKTHINVTKIPYFNNQSNSSLYNMSL